MEKGAQAGVVTALIIAICSAAFAAYSIQQLSGLETRIEELEGTIITVGVTIDYGDGNVQIETVHLTKGASALEALRRIAAVKTEYYPMLGDYIVSINGTSENMEANKYWMWYIWDENGASWELAPIGAGSYELEDGDNIKFSYEIVSW
jgi:hypothetical protein